MYLAVVLDAFSRRVIGWALGRTLEAELTLTALRMALIERQPAPGLVHHSDRGVQYASQDYTEMLKRHDATISMSRKGNPYDNAKAESFMKTLKSEEVYRNEYRDSLSRPGNKESNLLRNSKARRQARLPVRSANSVESFTLYERASAHRIHETGTGRFPGARNRP